MILYQKAAAATATMADQYQYQKATHHEHESRALSALLGGSRAHALLVSSIAVGCSSRVTRGGPDDGEDDNAKVTNEKTNAEDVDVPSVLSARLGASHNNLPSFSSDEVQQALQLQSSVLADGSMSPFDVLQKSPFAEPWMNEASSIKNAKSDSTKAEHDGNVAHTEVYNTEVASSRVMMTMLHKKKHRLRLVESTRTTDNGISVDNSSQLSFEDRLSDFRSFLASL